MAINVVLLDGTLTEDATRKDLTNGLVILNLKHEGPVREGRNGPWSKSMYVDASVWGGLSNSVADLKQGAYVIVQGEMEYRSWETADGSKRGKHQINASAVTVGSAPITMTPPSGETATAPAQSTPVATPPVDDDIPF